MSTASGELDPAVKHALNFLHSSNPKSAEDIRNCLDEIIKQRYGPNKMLINTISQKHLDEEVNAPGTKIAPELVEVHSSPVISLSPSDDQNAIIGETVDLSDDVENLKEFGDLACVVCGEMMFSATNRLIECTDCHSLYHQDCHKPHISDDDANEQEFSWCCSTCKDKIIAAAAADVPLPLVAPPATKSSESSSTHSSASSSPYNQPHHEHTHTSSSKSKGNSSKNSSSSSTTKDNNVGKSTSSSKSGAGLVPSITIRSAPDKSSSGGSSSSSSSRKHHQSKSKSSSSSSRDHSDRKRKSSK